MLRRSQRWVRFDTLSTTAAGSKSSHHAVEARIVREDDRFPVPIPHHNHDLRLGEPQQHQDHQMPPLWDDVAERDLNEGFLPTFTTTSGERLTTSPPTSVAELLGFVDQTLLTLLDGGEIDARGSRQGQMKTKVGACNACRLAKSKCNGSSGTSCPRCLASGLECEYKAFQKRGRKRGLTPNMIKLQEARSALSKLTERLQVTIPVPSPPLPCSFEPSRALLPSSSTNSSPTFFRSGHSSHRPLHSSSRSTSNGSLSNIHSPLAVLAHVSAGLEDQDGNSDDDELLLHQSQYQYQPPTSFVAQKKLVPEKYFAGGLYRSRPDSNPENDPINCGILSLGDFERLVNFFFDHLHPYCWHLNRQIHTVPFLRSVSPFLTTVLAYQAAGFCPRSGAIVGPLLDHVTRLAGINFSEGFKSLEIIQGYCLLLHWQPLAKSASRDRQWNWMCMAVTMATEIRLERPIDKATLATYANLTQLPPDAEQIFSADRKRTWLRLFGAHIATSVETGRQTTLLDMSAFPDKTLAGVAVAPDDPEMGLNAMASLNSVYAKALLASANWEESPDAVDGQRREEYNVFWKSALHKWRQDWPHAGPWPNLICQHAWTILLSVSLRFRGPVTPILEQCRLSAYEVVRMVVEWPDDTIRYANNFIVVNISYAATMALRFCGKFPEAGPTDEEIKYLCGRLAGVLDRISDTRLHNTSPATLHAARIRRIIAEMIPGDVGVLHLL
ncbi:hypothetical protein T439DRAFT_336229 [Meredithblackwellia eburnea MCA 4105]